MIFIAATSIPRNIRRLLKTFNSLKQLGKCLGRYDSKVAHKITSRARYLSVGGRTAVLSFERRFAQMIRQFVIAALDPGNPTSTVATPSINARIPSTRPEMNRDKGAAEQDRPYDGWDKAFSGDQTRAAGLGDGIELTENF